jgi:hypothetical protein
MHIGDHRAMPLGNKKTYIITLPYKYIIFGQREEMSSERPEKSSRYRPVEWKKSRSESRIRAINRKIK